MKRLNGFIFPAILFFILIFAFSSCSSKSADKSILGKWTLGEEFSTAGYRFPKTMEFFSDGSINIQADTGGTYTIDGNRMQIYYSAMDSYTYTFSIEGDMLKMTSTEVPNYGEYIYYRDSADTDSETASDKSSSDTSSLAASCDYVLAEGTSTAGDKFELVANDSQSYDSTQSVGLIKNGKWFIEMTDNSPIIDENGSVYYFSSFKGEYDRYISPDWNTDTYPNTYRLVSNNCFLLGEYILWNFETGKTYTLPGDYRSYYKFSENITNENKVILHIVSEYSHNEVTYKILDTKNMAVIKEFDKDDFYSVGIFSEGLFYAVTRNTDLDGDGYTDKAAGFYDENGNLIINLSKYNITEGGVFSNGKATVTAENDTGKQFEITIDKAGNVLSEEAIN